jgi:GNAT superfamily N-acetyltransferase
MSARDAAEIRPAEPGDAEAMARLSAELGYPATPAEVRERLAALAVDPREVVLVAAAGGEVIGWIQVGVTLSLESEPFAEIRGLVVAEDRRGGGIGAALVARAEAWAAARGCARIRVRSNVVRERAHRFYARAGYRVAKTQAVFEKGLAAPS